MHFDGNLSLKVWSRTFHCNTVLEIKPFWSFNSWDTAAQPVLGYNLLVKLRLKKGNADIFRSACGTLTKRFPTKFQPMGTAAKTCIFKVCSIYCILYINHPVSLGSPTGHRHPVPGLLCIGCMPLNQSLNSTVLNFPAMKGEH